MKRKKFIKNRKAAGSFLVTIVVLLGVMFAAIIGAIVFFEFGSSAHTAQTHLQTFSATNTTNASLSLTWEPISSSVSVEKYNSSDGNWTAVSSALVSVSGKTVTIDTSAMDTNLSQLRVDYNDLGYDTTTSVITYAVIVFGMLALVPLILIGGLMLSSLGFFGTGKV